MSKPIKVLFLIPSFGIGGLESHLAKQLHYFDTTKFELHVAALFFYPNRPSIVERFPVYVKSHKIFFLQGYNPLSWFRLFRMLYQVKPDIVFGSMFPGNMAAVIGHLFFRYKVVTREHNLYPEKTKLHIFFDRVSSYITSRIITVSKGVAASTSEQMGIPYGKFLVIENGINVDEVIEKKKTISQKGLAEIRNFFNLLEGEKVILNVSRIKKQKNHNLMVDAYKQYRLLGGTQRLFIVGEGSERSDLQEYINKQGLNEYITLTGHRSDVDLFYSIASVFVLTSVKEGFANVVLESLAFGVPVVSTNVPGSVDIIKNGYNGFLVSHDPLEIAERIKELGGAERKITKEQCVESVRPYDLTINVKRYSDLILSLVRVS